jgi:predicted sulfurtransferase
VPDGMGDAGQRSEPLQELQGGLQQTAAAGRRKGRPRPWQGRVYVHDDDVPETKDLRKGHVAHLGIVGEEF